MIRGPKPKPVALKLINGNPGKRPINRDEPKPEHMIGDPPDWMNDHQKEEWRHIVKNAPPGMLSEFDSGVVRIEAVAAAAHRDAASMVARTGTLYRDNRGTIHQNPALKIANQQAMLMLRAAAELGMTPTARARMISVKDESDANPWAAFAG